MDMKKSLAFALVIFATAVLSAPCNAQELLIPGQGPIMGGPAGGPAAATPQPRVTISLFPGVSFPAMETGEDVVASCIGGGFSFGINFVRGRVAAIGMDFSGFVGIPSDEGTGSWIGTSVGLPIRLGSRGPGILLRPGINLDVLNYHVGDSYSYTEADWNSSVGLGASLLLSFELNFSRFGFGFFGCLEYLLSGHKGTEYHYGVFEDDLVGRFTLMAGLRLTIRI